MGVGLTMSARLDAKGQIQLRRLARSAHALKPALADMGEYLVRATRKRFDSERGPDGEPWKPLTDRYVARPKRRGGRGGARHPILVRPGAGGGRLRGSIVHREDDRALQVGTNAKFPGGRYSRAAIHQLGGLPGMAPGPRAIPARPFLGIGAEDRAPLLTILERHLARAAEAR